MFCTTECINIRAKILLTTIMLLHMATCMAINPDVIQGKSPVQLAQALKITQTLQASQLNQAAAQTVIAPTGQTITTDGNYVLNNTPPLAGANQQNALVINGSNITINLNGITLGSKTSTTHLAGIQIAAGSNNITICNGIIAGFEIAGIDIQGTPTNPVRNIYIQNVMLPANTCGIRIAYTNGVSIDSCATQSSNHLGSAGGFLLASCSNITINNCVCNSSESSSTDAYGIALYLCNQIIISNTQTHMHHGHTQAHGIICSQCTLASISNCCASFNQAEGPCCGICLNKCTTISLCSNQTHNNTSRTSKSHGIQLIRSYAITVDSCSSSRNTCGFYDDEQSPTDTNLFIHNNALLNTHDYHRPFNNPISKVILHKGYLQDSLKVGILDNVSVEGH